MNYKLLTTKSLQVPAQQSNSTQATNVKQSVKSLIAKTKSTIKPAVVVDFSLEKIVDKYVNENSKYELDYFVSTLKQNQWSDQFVLTMFDQLKQLIHLLEPTRFETTLVDVLFIELKWHEHFSSNQLVLERLATFLVELNCAYTCYMTKCITMLVKWFALAKSDDDSNVQCEDKTSLMNYENLYKWAHTILAQFVRVAPACKSQLTKIVDQQYPYLTKNTHIQDSYIRNVLQLAQVNRDLRQSLLEICIQRMLKIDVKLTREQIIQSEQEQTISGDESHTTTSMPLESLELSTTPESELAAVETSMKNPLADRLDVMMKRMFEFIRANCYSPMTNQFDWDSCKSIYKELLFVFDKYILCTYGSSHVQFLMFYICSFKSLLTEGFIDYLWKQFSLSHSCAIRRQVCSYYLGSYLSRAKYIPITTCVATMQLMVNWLHNYIHKFNESTSHQTFDSFMGMSRGASVTADVHRTFYALCQSLFYIVIYRHRQLFNRDSYDPNQGISAIGESLKTWKLNEIISSRLNPLRYVLPSVRTKFARITYVNQIAYCYAIIDANNRITLPMSGQQNNCFNSFYSMIRSTTSTNISRKLDAENPLDSFFPFDPYLLHRSRSSISSFYQEFQDIDDEDNDDESEEDSDEEEEEEEEENDNDNDDEDDESVEEKSGELTSINSKKSELGISSDLLARISSYSPKRSVSQIANSGSQQFDLLDEGRKRLKITDSEYSLSASLAEDSDLEGSDYFF